MSTQPSGASYSSTARLTSGSGGVSLTGITASRLLKSSATGTALEDAALTDFVAASGGVVATDDGSGGVAVALDSTATPTFAGLKMNAVDATVGDIWKCTAVDGTGRWTAPAALTRTNDSNVTLTLGGSASTALLNAASITVGWNGVLAVQRGGTGRAEGYSLGALLYGLGTSSQGMQILEAPTAAVKHVLTSTGTGTDPDDPVWDTLTAADVGISAAALTKTDDTNVTLTLGGTPTTALLQATSITAGWTGQLAVSRGGTGQGSYTVGDVLYASGTSTLSKLSGPTSTTKQVLTSTGTGVAAQAPAWGTLSATDVGITAAALSKADDSNVTLTLTGTPSTALLQGVTITAGWTGQLPISRGGTNLSTVSRGDLIIASDHDVLSRLTGNSSTTKQFLSSAGTGSSPLAATWSTITAADVGITGAALTKTDDTNVTLTLGGSPATAMLQATSLTLGWTGSLAVTRGGTGLSTIAQGAIPIASATNTITALPGNTTVSRQFLTSVGVALIAQPPAWVSLAATDIISGTLSVARGGTGLSTVPQGALLAASALNTISALSIGAANTVLVSNGTIPNWVASPQLTSLGLGVAATGTTGQLKLTSAVVTDTFTVNNNAGTRMLYLNTTANQDILIGRGLMASPGANSNVIIGFAAAPSNSGVRCVIIGSGGVGANKTTGNDCILIGGQGCGQNVTGPDNICLGRSMCIAATLTGQYNLFFGTNCARNVGGGSTSNTAIGVNALENLITGNSNVAIGQDALKSAAGGNWSQTGNTAIGAEASQRYVTGTGLVCIGYRCGMFMSGARNTLMGYEAGYANGGVGTTQNDNTMIGYQAGYSNNAGSGNVFLGYQAGRAETGSNKLYISNSSTATPLIGGDFSAATVTITGRLTTTAGLVTQSAALATSATTGFLYIPTCAGVPSGVPTSFTGTCALVYDSTNNQMYVYNGAWRMVAVA